MHNIWVNNAQKATTQLHIMQVGIMLRNISLEVNKSNALHDQRAVASCTVPIGTIVPVVQVRAHTYKLTQAINGFVEYVD